MALLATSTCICCVFCELQEMSDNKHVCASLTVCSPGPLDAPLSWTYTCPGRTMSWTNPCPRRTPVQQSCLQLCAPQPCASQLRTYLLGEQLCDAALKL